jgi:voltage-gated potassium channel
VSGGGERVGASPRNPATPARRLIVAVSVLGALTTLGTVGYVVIEGVPVVDALYMTVITISTVGYGEVVPLGPAGRMFTIGLIVSGVGTAFYLLVSIAELLIEGHLRDFLGRTAMQHRVDRLSEHVIVCGFGRFGRVVAEELGQAGLAVVIVDADAAKEPELVRAGVPYLIGSALSDEVLDRAGIRRARAIVVATASDSDNVFVTLSAREKNPAIRIHARGESDGGLRRLRLAGADQVISAYQTGGLRMAAAIARPSVVDFLEIAMPGRGEEVDLEEIRVDRGSTFVGAAIQAIERDSPRLRVVALKRTDEAIRIVPEPTSLVRDGDHLLVIGERGALERLAQLAQSPER